MSDSSIRTEGGQEVEIVTPVLRYSDIEDLQEIVRKLRKLGAKAHLWNSYSYRFGKTHG